MRSCRFVPLLVCLCIAMHAFSQPGTIDSSFGSNGRATSQLGNNYHSFSRSIAVQKDGKIVLCGDSLTGSVYSFGLSRFHADGSRDRSFGKKGSVNTPMPPGGPSGLNAIALQKDGKIITGAYSVADHNFYLFRYLPGGKPDVSFGKDGMATVSIGEGGEIFLSQIVVQDDGKIITAGSNDGFLIARCLPNGNMDSSFGVNGILTKTGDLRFVDEVISLPGGGMYVGTSRTGAAYNSKLFELDRLLPNGDGDDSFGYFGAVAFNINGVEGDDYASGIALLPDGDILEVGTTNIGNAIIKCRPDGSLDPSFGTNGIVSPVSPSHSFARVLVQPDGKIIVADSYLTRLMPDGKRDSSFGNNGSLFSSDQFESAILLPDGKILTHATPYSILTRYRGDDARVSVKKDISVKEGNSGYTPATFTVVLNKATTDTVKIGYTTVDKTATAGKDYVATSGMLVFVPGIISKTININVIGDKQAESNETFSLQLQNPVHGMLDTKPAGTCTITNDDGKAFASDRESPEERPMVAYAKLSLFPNPAGDHITVTGLPGNNSSTVRIMDAGGRQVLEKATTGSQCRINTSELHAGIYYVTVRNQSGTVRLQFTKE